MAPSRLLGLRCPRKLGGIFRIRSSHARLLAGLLADVAPSSDRAQVQVTPDTWHR